MKIIIFFRILMGLFGIAASNVVVAADITGAWHTQGMLQVDINIENEKTMKKAAYDQCELIFGPNKFVVDGQTFQLAGTWSRKNASFRGNLDTTSVNAFLGSMAADFEVKSGLIITPAVSALSFSGTELANGSIRGEWVITSKASFPKQPGRAGVLHISYRFTGTRTK